MKIHTLAFASLAILGFLPQAVAEQRLMIRLHPASGTDISTLAAKYGASVVGAVRQSGRDHVFLVSVADGESGDRAIQGLRKDPAVASAERDTLAGLPIVTMANSAAPAKLNMPLLLNGLRKNKYSTFFGTVAWNGYLNQPAAEIIGISGSRRYATGAGVVALIDTGVDSTHPVLAPALVAGWDFVRGISGGQEEADLTQEVTPILDDQEVTPILDAGGIAIINDQEVTPILDDQEVTPILDQTLPAALGHGTMTAGIIHLVAPTAQIMPLKAFKSDGTGKLSDIVQAIYYAVDHGANVISMSFDTQAAQGELRNAIDYASAHGVLCVASVGNNGQDVNVYPAGVGATIGVASTDNYDVRSWFSNYGDTVKVAGPGEGVISTYPRNRYAAGWGTSFSAPMVAGAAALLVQIKQDISIDLASTSIAQAAAVSSPGMGAGRLDLVRACSYASSH